MKIPEKIGRYKIQKELGRGAMGIVFEAIDEDLDRKVAAKMLPKAFISNEEQSARFKQEAKIVAKLDHPNIMRVYGIEYAEDTIWIIMEYIQGKSLDAILKEKGTFLYSEALPLITQMLSALGYAHSKGIVHRDIKPANIMVSSHNTIKIMDFGIARDEGAETGLTRTGTVMGTPKYMSPEQFKAKGIDARSDIYSLSVMIYEMLTGSTPFTADTFMEYAFKHLNDKPPPIKKKINNLPKDISDFIMMSLLKNKEERPSDLLKIKFLEEDKETIMLKKPEYKKSNKPYLMIIIIISALFFAIFFIKNKPSSFIKNEPKEIIKILDNNIIETEKNTSFNNKEESKEKESINIEKPKNEEETKLIKEPPKEELKIITQETEPLKNHENILQENNSEKNITHKNENDKSSKLKVFEQSNKTILYSLWKNEQIHELRDTLKQKYKNRNFSVNDYKDIKEILEDYLNLLRVDTLIIDTISWCVISLEKSNHQKLMEVLLKYDDDKVHKKIRGYAKRAIKNSNAFSITAIEKAKLSREDILIMELQSEDFLKVRIASKEIYIEKLRSEKIMDEILIFLTKYLADPVDNKNASDAIAYLCLILGESGKKDNIEILNTIRESDLGWKIKRYAKEAINMLEGKEKSFFSFLDF